MVRLPQSAPAKRTIGAQLIRCIVQGRFGALRLAGVFLRPGKLVEESNLWPGPDWPRVPHLLEMREDTRPERVDDESGKGIWAEGTK